MRWFDTLSLKAIQKCHVRLERLEQLGHELRRPEADYLRDGIHELRATYQGVHHRMLYFFHGRAAVIVSHGLVKERAVPPREIDLAVRRKGRQAKGVNHGNG
jgi:phage-related protein